MSNIVEVAEQPGAESMRVPRSRLFGRGRPLVAAIFGAALLMAAQSAALWGLDWSFRNGIPLYSSEYMHTQNVFYKRFSTDIFWGIVLGLAVERAFSLAEAGRAGRASRLLRASGATGFLVTGVKSSALLGLAIVQTYSPNPFTVDWLARGGISFEYLSSSILQFAGNPAFFASLAVLIWGFRSKWRREDTVQVGAKMRW